MLLWADGFDHYGDDESNLLDGVYADNRATLDSTNPATGTHCVLLSQTSENVNDPRNFRKVLSSSTLKIGVGMRIFFPVLPSTGSRAGILALIPTDTANFAHLLFTLGVNGQIEIQRGPVLSGGSAMLNGTVLGSTDPIIVANAWNHVEIQASIHDTEGWVRIAVNGVHKYEITGLDTKYNATEVGSVAFTRPYITANPTHNWYMDDLYIYDFDGDPAEFTDWCPDVDGITGVATNYLGEWQAMWLPPTADTAEDDWVPSTGADAFAMVDEVTPNDADYIYSTTAGDLTEMELTDIPEDITVVRGLMVVGRMSKSDSGPAMIKYGMKSVAAVEDAPERPITVEPTYWWDFFNTDPNSGARWTRASLNAAWVRLTRSA
jgi:hypothetical protein